MKKSRIFILDSFRAIAIIGVILYHYFSRFTFPKNKISLYPYNNSYDFFSLGYLGVEFFFIISGFVIFFTLENTQNFSAFWIKRFIRLVPPIVITSIITFIILGLIDKEYIFPFSHSIENFLPSISFISPQIFNTLTNTDTWGYIDGSYWSLWPEVQFYLLSSIIYFINKKNFVKNFMLISIILILGNTALKFLETKHGFGFVPLQFFVFFELLIDKGFNLLNYLPFFCLGFSFYLMFKDYNNGVRSTTSTKVFVTFLIIFVLLIQGGLDVPILNRLITALMLMLFFAFIYGNKYLKFLENRLFIKIGECSYILYLIHQNIGVALIFYFGKFFMPQGFWLPLIISTIMVLASLLYSEKVDNKLGKWLRIKLLRK